MTPSYFIGQHWIQEPIQLGDGREMKPSVQTGREAEICVDTSHESMGRRKEEKKKKGIKKKKEERKTKERAR